MTPVTYLFVDDGFSSWTQQDISESDWEGWNEGKWSIFKIEQGAVYPLVFDNASVDDTPDWMELIQK